MQETKRLHNFIIGLFTIIFVLCVLLVHLNFVYKDLCESIEKDCYLVDTKHFKVIDILHTGKMNAVSSVQYRSDSTEMLFSVELDDVSEIDKILPEVKYYFIRFMNEHKVIGRGGEPHSYGVLTITDNKNNKVAQYILPNVNSTELIQLYKGYSVMYYVPELIDR